MKTLKKVGAFALVLALMVTILSGCADPQTNNGGNATTNPTKAPDQSVEPEKTEEPRETYAITIMNSGNAERYPEEILIQEKMEEALNLDITIESAPGTSYLESIQMMLTSGDYPELVIFNDEMKETLFTDAVKNGAFIALDDYLVNSPNLMEYSYDASWEALKVLNDDKVYGIPRTSIARADGYLIRQDWLDKVGISYTEGEPMTIAQLEEIVEAFTNDDPDGNSANDTYGISAYATPNGTMEVLFPSTFGLLGWQNYDGEYMDIKYSLDHDNFEKALTFSNKMWEAGFVDPDWPTIQLDVGLERFKKGVTGAFFPTFAGSMLGVENGGRDMNPDYTLSYVVGVVENAGDQVIAGNYSTGYYGFWGVSSAAEKPERVVELLDYMLSDEIWDEIKYGPKGVTWEEQNGQKVDIWDPEKKTGNMWKAFVRRNNDPEFFLGLNLTADEKSRLENLIQISIDNFTFAEDRGFRPSVADDPKFIEYVNNMEVQITKMIVGDIPISDWKEKILPGWYEAGGEEYVKQMQEFIKSVN